MPRPSPRYLSSYDPRWCPPARLVRSTLDMAEDGFRPHASGPYTLKVRLPDDFVTGEHHTICCNWIRDFCREHRIGVVNHGMVEGHALRLNFVSKLAAAKFKMLWCGWGDDCKVYVVESETIPFWGRCLWSMIHVTFDRQEGEKKAHYYTRKLGRRVRLREQNTETDPPE